MLSRTMIGVQVGLVGGHQDPPGSKEAKEKGLDSILCQSRKTPMA